MTCNETIHVEYAKAMKKFCQDCGKELPKQVVNIVEQLRKHFDNTIYSYDELFAFIVENQLILNETIIKHKRKLYLLDAFVKEFSFMKFPKDFRRQSKYIYDPVNFDEKMEESKEEIPTDLLPISIDFCKRINKKIKNFQEVFEKKDATKVLQFIEKKFLTFMVDDESQQTIQQYLLQDCLKKNKYSVEHENEDGRTMNIRNCNIQFVNNAGSLVRTFSSDGEDVIIRPSQTGFYYCSDCSQKCTDIGAIREWFNTRPESWIRNKELEEEYLKQYK